MRRNSIGGLELAGDGLTKRRSRRSFLPRWASSSKRPLYHRTEPFSKVCVKCGVRLYQCGGVKSRPVNEQEVWRICGYGVWSIAKDAMLPAARLGWGGVGGVAAEVRSWRGAFVLLCLRRKLSPFISRM
jgi:hypothetical protein